MPHTTTTVQRNKRPDTRPNAKQRHKMGIKLEQKKAIQDLRVTKKQGKKRERDVDTTVPLKSKTQKKSADEKHIRALKKKLKAVDELIQRQNDGEELDPQQLEKIARLDELMQDMEEALKEVDIDLSAIWLAVGIHIPIDLM